METYIATVLLWAPNFAPLGWSYCNGGLVAISQNQALFALIGNTYGGDGQTTFALPDLRSRVPIGAGMGQGPGLTFYQRGVMGGVEDVTLTQTTMPEHMHVAQGELRAFDTPGTSQSPDAGQVLAAANTQQGPNTLPTRSYAAAAGSPVTLSNQSTSLQIGSAGGNLPHENRMPFLGLSYIIAMVGIFPPHS